MLLSLLALLLIWVSVKLRQLMRDDKLNDSDVYDRYSGLYARYDSSFANFECIAMVFRLAFVCLTNALSKPSTQVCEL